MSRTRRFASIVVVLFLVCVVVASSFYISHFNVPTVKPSDLASLTYWTEQYPPYNYLENGTLKGVSVDLLGLITQSLGGKVTPDQIHLSNWSESYQATLTQNRTVLFSTVRLPSRETSFKWAGPIWTYKYTLFMGCDKPITINSNVDLKNYRIGVISDDAAIPLLLDAGVDRSQLVAETNASTIIDKLARGDIDLWCYPEEVGRFLTEQVTGNYYLFDVAYRLEENDLYYAFSLDTTDIVVQAFQHAIDTLKREKDNSGFSTYEMILGSYIPSIGFGHLNYLTEQWTPFNYDKDGAAAGISVEILQSIFRHAGVESTPDVKIVPLADGFNQLQKNSSSVLFSIVRTPEREPYYKWVGPFTKANFVIYSNKNITLASAEDLNTYRIGTVNATIEYNFLLDHGVSSSNIVVAPTPRDLLLMLKNGEIDLWATGEVAGHYEINREGLNTGEYRSVYNLGEEELYFIFSKDIPDLIVNAFNHALSAIKNQKDAQGFSEYDRIIYRNLGVGYAMQKFTNQQVVSLVDSTVNAIKANVADVFLRINAGDNPYRDPQNSGLYVFVYDTNVTMVAHADNILLVGVNFHGKTDITGKPFHDTLVSGALENGTGWVEYVYSDPVQMNLYYKTTYYRLVTGSDGNLYVVCSENFKSY